MPGEEPGLPDVEIRLSGPEGEKKTKTDKNGRFEFAVTKPGTYTVSEQIPSGWAPTTPSSFDINIGDFDHVTVPEILFGNEVTPSKCIAFHEVKKGRGMGIRILEPNNPEVTSKENEPIPLVVHSSDQDLVYHYCECKGEGIAWDTIEIVDMIDYDWLILSESLLSGKTLTNGGKVSVNKGPGIFFISPEIELGEIYKC